MKYNMNRLVTVKLTKKGKEILEYKNIRVQGDIYTTQLWELFSVFGAYLYNGCEIPFQKNEIDIQ